MQRIKLALAKKELIFKDELTAYQIKMEHVVLYLARQIESTIAPIFGIDNQGLVNEWNQTSKKTTDFKKHEVIRKNLVQNYITKKFPKAVKKVLHNALLGKETANYEFPQYTKNGVRIMVLLNSTRRRDKKGNIIGVLGVGQETTEFVTYPNELELQVKQRTINLKDPLIGKKRLTELKYKFIATISHAYRTPLAPINFAAGFVNQYWAKTEPVAVAQN